jgi:hypothetical protein
MATRNLTSKRSLVARDMAGLHQYEDFDPGWLASVWNDIFRSKLPFPVATKVSDSVYRIPNATTVAIAGDWGTGNASSARIASEIAKLTPDYTIHLGDVYYSGTEGEEQSKFVDLWPAGTKGSLALNSNHEMYSGGHGYFGVALTAPKFRMQSGLSYFALTNDTWLIIGLDSAYGASSFYQTGALNNQQLTWLTSLLASPVANNGQFRKNVMVLTHHQGLQLDGSVVEPLWSQVTQTLGQGPHRWYWGHVHNVAAFAPRNCGGVDLRARLVGHGGVPYAPDPHTGALEWTEDTRAGDPQLPSRALNGFALLRFTDDGLEETFYDELGRVRWSDP